MQENDQLVVTIHLIHGNPIKFEVALSASKEFGLSDDIERSLLRNAMAVELDKKLLLIPYNNIKYIESDPAPPVLPQNIIRGARSLKV
ncbi:MAG: hypothetical protein HW386_2008 [Gammaproteobacteria bacterium]|nr:hypothetical protein [Gammaproteobacteria bacterium]